MSKTNIKPIVIGLCLAATILCIITGLAFLSRNILIPIQTFPTALITKFPVATSTTTGTSIEEGKLNPTKQASSDIGIGSFVQITGTNGVGLRVRIGAGIDSAPQFVAMENEIFEVKDGPVLANDFTWWFLVAPYDSNRKGWAAGQYLTVIDNP